MALREFRYDNPNYTVVRQAQFLSGGTGASATAFAQFRSRVKVVVNAITVVVNSASSLAKVVFIAQRGGSTNTTFTIASCTSVGAMTVVACAITLASAGDLLNLVHNDIGGYHVLYEYNVVPTGAVYSNQ